VTAEVAVMNANGVALAADSAVTIGQEATKIYTSAEKLFQLSGSAPVGIMIYGNASFVGVPWETVIKSYRKKLGAKTFLTLDEYAKDFIRFVNGSRAIFPQKRQDEGAVRLMWLFYLFLRDRIADRINTEAEQNDGLSEPDVEAILTEEINKHHADIRKSKFLIGHGAKTLAGIRKKYSRMVGEVIREIFGNLPIASAAKRKLNSIGPELLARDYFGNSKSGVVFAGYGEQEYLPSLIHFEFEDMIGNRARYAERVKQAIGQLIRWPLLSPRRSSTICSTVALKQLTGTYSSVFWHPIDPSLMRPFLQA
jgi:hypothetical protein